MYRMLINRQQASSPESQHHEIDAVLDIQNISRVQFSNHSRIIFVVSKLTLLFVPVSATSRCIIAFFFQSSFLALFMINDRRMVQVIIEAHPRPFCFRFLQNIRKQKAILQQSRKIRNQPWTLQQCNNQLQVDRISNNPPDSKWCQHQRHSQHQHQVPRHSCPNINT